MKNQNTYIVGERSFPCMLSSTCHSAFRRLKGLNVHIINVHGGKPYTMKTWNAKFKRNADLTKRKIQTNWTRKVEDNDVQSSGPPSETMKPTIGYADDIEPVRKAQQIRASKAYSFIVHLINFFNKKYTNYNRKWSQIHTYDSWYNTNEDL